MALEEYGDRTLVVVLIAGTALKGRNSWASGGSEPYCVCQVKGKEHLKIRTDNFIGSVKQADWNYKAELTGIVKGDVLEFFVLDGGKGKNDFSFGQAKLDVPDPCMQFDDKLRLQKTIKGANADLFIKITEDPPKLLRKAEQIEIDAGSLGTFKVVKEMDDTIVAFKQRIRDEIIKRGVPPGDLPMKLFGADGDRVELDEKKFKNVSNGTKLELELQAVLVKVSLAEWGEREVKVFPGDTVEALKDRVKDAFICEIEGRCGNRGRHLPIGISSGSGELRPEDLAGLHGGTLLKAVLKDRTFRASLHKWGEKEITLQPQDSFDDMVQNVRNKFLPKIEQEFGVIGRRYPIGLSTEIEKTKMVIELSPSNFTKEITDGCLVLGRFWNLKCKVNFGKYGQKEVEIEIGDNLEKFQAKVVEAFKEDIVKSGGNPADVDLSMSLKDGRILDYDAFVGALEKDDFEADVKLKARCFTVAWSDGSKKEIDSEPGDDFETIQERIRQAFASQIKVTCGEKGLSRPVEFFLQNGDVVTPDTLERFYGEIKSSVVVKARPKVVNIKVRFQGYNAVDIEYAGEKQEIIQDKIRKKYAVLTKETPPPNTFLLRGAFIADLEETLQDGVEYEATFKVMNVKVNLDKFGEKDIEYHAKEPWIAFVQRIQAAFAKDILNQHGPCADTKGVRTALRTLEDTPLEAHDFTEHLKDGMQLKASYKCGTIDDPVKLRFLNLVKPGELRSKPNFTQDPGPYEQAVKMNPKSATAWCNLGSVGGGMVDDKPFLERQCYEKALELDPKHSALFNLATVGGGKIHGEAWTDVKCYRTLIDRGSQDSEVWNNFGALGGDDVYSSKFCFEKTVELRPEHATAWNNLGTVGGGRGLTAKECYEKSLELDPENNQAFSNLGVSGGGKVSGVDYSEKECYLEALKFNPEYAPAFTNLGTCLKQETVEVDGDTLGAKDCFIRALQLNPLDGDAWVNYGTLGGGDELDAAYTKSECFEKALRMNRNDHAAWYNLGIVGQANFDNQIWDAKQCYEKCLELNPRIPHAWNCLGSLGGGTVNGKEYAELDCYKTALELQPGYVDALLNLGCVAEKEFVAGGKTYTSKMCFQEVTELDDTCAEAWYNLGINGGTDASPKKECYIKVLDLAPDDPLLLSDTWNNLGSNGGGEIQKINYSPRACFKMAMGFNPENEQAANNLKAVQTSAGRRTIGSGR